MHVSPNPVLVRFSTADAPDVWTSRQAERLFAAGLEGESDGSWSTRAVQGTVTTAPLPTDPAASPYGTCSEEAAARATRRAAELRAEADRIEQVLETYGGEAFVMQPEPVNKALFRGHGYEGALCAVMRSKPTDIWVNGRRFSRDESGSYVRNPN